MTALIKTTAKMITASAGSLITAVITLEASRIKISGFLNWSKNRIKGLLPRFGVNTLGPKRFWRC